VIRHVKGPATPGDTKLWWHLGMDLRRPKGRAPPGGARGPGGGAALPAIGHQFFVAVRPREEPGASAALSFKGPGGRGGGGRGGRQGGKESCYGTRRRPLDFEKQTGPPPRGGKGPRDAGLHKHAKSAGKSDQRKIMAARAERKTGSPQAPAADLGVGGRVIKDPRQRNLHHRHRGKE